MNLILASGSPRRRELLSLYTTNFTVCVSDFDESAVQAATPAHLVEQLARGKCLAVSAQHPGAVVIGCDTVVDVNGEVFGKPHSEEDAKRMLRALSGATHEVHTGVCISDGTRTESFVDSCRVTFFPLGEEEIDFYASAAAYLKGIRGYDAEHALEAMKISAEKNKKGADYYIKEGFIPTNIKKESVSCLLEFAYDDWCIAQMAKALGHMDDYETFIKRSQNFINVFDGSTRFFRGKRQDGNWETPFDPFAIGRSYTEATAWQYRFFTPHDVYGLTQLFGGREAFIADLDSLFMVTSEVVGDLVDVTGLVGQYAHGNEPSHHMAYLYSYVGQPWKTQEWTRRLLDEMYQPTPEGIIGNEDCGQMSAWYILSSLGFYSVCPGSNQFILTTPLFDKANMKLGNGKTLVITANQPDKNKYITKVTLNGEEISHCYIT